MNDETEESTRLFLLCIGFYLLTGLLIKFTGFIDWLDEGSRWYHDIVFVLTLLIAATFGFVALIHPYGYIKANLKKWGMIEGKADTLAFVFCIGGLLLWYFIFIFKSSSD